jgi:hypothetical protein
MTTLSCIFKRRTVWYYKRGKQGRSGYLYITLRTGSRRLAEERQKSLDQEYWLKTNCPGIYIQDLIERNGVTLEEVVGLIVNSNVGSHKVSILGGFQEWLSQLTFSSDANRKHKTNNINKIGKWFSNLFSDKLIHEISFVHVNRFIKWMDEELGLAKRTQSDNLSILRQFYKWAVLHYGLKKNPTIDGVLKIIQKDSDKIEIPGVLLFNTIDKVGCALYERMSKHGDTYYNKKIGFGDPNNARKDQIFWTLIAFTGAWPVDAMNMIPDDFIGHSRRRKSNIKVKYIMVPQLAKFGSDLFGIFHSKSERDYSGKRFKILTGYTLKNIRTFFLNEMHKELKDTELKAVAGHTPDSKTLDKSYLNADTNAIESALQLYGEKFLG